ncbi:Retrovirus-related Pol polyprotein from transposon TNT 1-94 [Vitis vinifera]|uniref:Retrovirus-related Pol polyprotein from transposon TNT 1-94 n=1 Tax=Vitis vinifera TaxID=29760 RepID=A0A438GQQ7_VITVI|nr:Retrovirus-related Pol polyprotein from transposon TNT 1-94 [Vitis vinifera]
MVKMAMTKINRTSTEFEATSEATQTTNGMDHSSANSSPQITIHELNVTVFHSGHLFHLPKLSGQPYCGQKTLITVNIFPVIFSDDFSPAIFSDTDHIIRSAKRNLQLFSKHRSQTPIHAPPHTVILQRPESTRRRVRATWPTFRLLRRQLLPWPRPVCALERPLLHLQSLFSFVWVPTLDDTNSRGGRSGNQGQDNVLSAPIVISLVTLEIVAISYMDGLLALPTLLSHLILCYLDLTPLRAPHLRVSPFTGSDYDAYLRYQAATSAFVASVAHTGNASICFTQSPSLGPWILDFGASDHISGNKHIFSSITTTSTLPTVTLANGSQTMAKGIGLAHLSLPYLSILFFMPLSDRSTGKTIGIGRESQGLYHLTSPSSPAVCISTDAPLLIHSCLGHPSLSKFQKMVPRFSTLSSLACESCQLGKHTRVSFPKRLNNRAKSPFELVHTDDKLSAKATKCIFLGYSRLQKGYRCYSPDTHRYFLSVDVTFFEDSPFFSSSESLPFLKYYHFPYISPPSDALSHPLQVYHRRHCVVAPPLSSAKVPDDSHPIPPIFPTPALSSTDHLPITLRKGNRYTRNPHPIYNFLSYHRLSSSYSAFVSTLSSVSLPKSTSEALSHPGWRQAMVDEMAALHSNVGPDGQVDRLKARLIAKGYTQIYGCDYLNIKNAFLHGELLEEVYMEQPPGFVAQGESSLVCKLRRSLYGLKQSPWAWFGHFSSVVQKFGMLRSEADHSVFYHHNSSSQCIYLVVYVDDIVITGSDQEGIQRLKQHLLNHFRTKDLGKLKYFLGLEIAQSSLGVVMSQRKTRGASKRSWRYRRLVNKLNYLTITRPNISFPEHQAKVCCMKTGAIPKLLVTQMQTGLVHPQIGVPPQGIVFLLEIKLVCEIRPHYILHPIQSSMKGPSILKLTVTSLERRSHQERDLNFRTWRSKNSLVMAWLLNSMESSIAKPNMFMPITKAIWDSIRESYSDLENSSQIFELKQGDHEENPNDYARHMKHEENNRVYVFLTGVNGYLEEVKGWILDQKPLPSIHENLEAQPLFHKALNRKETREKSLGVITARNHRIPRKLAGKFMGSYSN